MSDVDISEIGASLVAHSQDQEISGRGLVTSLFPYIYTASKRMSTRAISAFLQEQHGVKLSAVTIAKALREPEKHVGEILERVEPAARTVALAHEVSAEAILRDGELFYALQHATPKILAESDDEASHALGDYEAAVEIVAREWHDLPTELRVLTLALLENKEDADDE
jgi:hypothetical protein